MGTRYRSAVSAPGPHPITQSGAGYPPSLRKMTSALLGDHVDMTATARTRSGCMGRETISTKVDEETVDWLDARARQAGISVAEYLRRLLDLYRQSQRGDIECGDCDARLNLTPGVEA